MLSSIQGYPSHHGTNFPKVTDVENSFQKWSLAANISIKQSRTAGKVWSYLLGFGGAVRS